MSKYTGIERALYYLLALAALMGVLLAARVEAQTFDDYPPEPRHVWYDELRPLNVNQLAVWGLCRHAPTGESLFNVRFVTVSGSAPVALDVWGNFYLGNPTYPPGRYGWLRQQVVSATPGAGVDNYIAIRASSIRLSFNGLQGPNWAAVAPNTPCGAIPGNLAPRLYYGPGSGGGASTAATWPAPVGHYHDPHIYVIRPLGES